MIEASNVKRRNTKQRATILDLLRGKKEPVSAKDLLSLAKEKEPNLNKTTIYRTLDRLIEENVVEAILLSGGIVHYELADEDSHHHHHFVCIKCDKAFCLEGRMGNVDSLLPKGFSLESHELILRGHCSSCRKSSKGKIK